MTPRSDLARSWDLLVIVLCVAILSFTLGMLPGYRWGKYEGRAMAVAELQPEVEANRLEIAVLNERIVNIRAAMAIETLASYYGESHRGKLMADGTPFDPDALTAASPWLPMGSKWTVTRIDTQASVNVVITDRGPAVRLGRGLDLSRAAAAKLGMIRRGVVAVRLSPEI